MLILGILNVLLAPIIFIWQLLQFLYNYTEVNILILFIFFYDFFKKKF